MWAAITPAHPAASTGVLGWTLYFHFAQRSWWAKLGEMGTRAPSRVEWVDVDVCFPKIAGAL